MRAESSTVDAGGEDIAPLLSSRGAARGQCERFQNIVFTSLAADERTDGRTDGRTGREHNASICQTDGL